MEILNEVLAPHPTFSRRVITTPLGRGQGGSSEISIKPQSGVIVPEPPLKL